jgi:hypothetical protein
MFIYKIEFGEKVGIFMVNALHLFHKMISWLSFKYCIAAVSSCTLVNQGGVTFIFVANIHIFVLYTLLG